MAAINESFGKTGVLLSRTYTDDAGATVTGAAFDAARANADTLVSRAQTALTANASYLAIGSPTNAQVAAQVATLTKECSAIIRLLLGALDSTAGT